MKNFLSCLCVILCIGFATTAWATVPDQDDNPVEIVQVSIDQDIPATAVSIKQVEWSQGDSYAYTNTISLEAGAQDAINVETIGMANLPIPDVPIYVNTSNKQNINLQILELFDTDVSDIPINVILEQNRYSTSDTSHIRAYNSYPIMDSYRIRLEDTRINRNLVNSRSVRQRC